MRKLSSRIISFICALVMLVTLIPTTTAYASTTPRKKMGNIRIRIDETYDLQNLSGLQNATISNVALDAPGNPLCKLSGTKIHAYRAGRCGVTFDFKVGNTNYKASALIIVTPKDTSKLRFSIDKHVLIHDTKIEDGKYRGANYVLTFYDGDKIVAKKGCKLLYSGVTDSWVSVGTPLNYTKVKVKVKYSNKYSIDTATEALRDKIEVTNGYIDGFNAIVELKYTPDRNRSGLYEPKFYYTVWSENNDGVQYVSTKVFNCRQSMGTRTFKKGVRGLTTGLKNPTIHASVYFHNLVYQE